MVQRPVGRGRSGEKKGRGIKNTGIGGCVPNGGKKRAHEGEKELTDRKEKKRCIGRS